MSSSKMPYVTLAEIAGQPHLWPEVLRSVEAIRPELERFFQSLPKVDVVMTGAGSSAFVAETVARDFERQTGWDTRAIATTDLVTHPEDHFRKRPTLLVSFARSGNSPESVAAVELANQVTDAYHLIITCNREGQLAKIGSSAKSFVVLLPDAANDRGLAMIGSVTGMILASLAVARRGSLDSLAKNVRELSQTAQAWLAGPQTEVKALAALPFTRVVCLGSGSLLSVAREAHLKIQELSNGHVMGQWDSFLGFRHGPRAIIDASTLVIYFSNPDPAVRRYEDDLMKSVAEVQRPIATWLIGSGQLSSFAKFKTDWPGVAPDLQSLASLVPVQVLAAEKSLSLGLNPDSPSPSGAIHRVVQGVTIYPYTAER